MEVRTIKELENLQLDYVDNRNGLYYSRITNESEIPYAGAAKGISVNKTGIATTVRLFTAHLMVSPVA
jgi:hypothetical protein